MYVYNALGCFLGIRTSAYSPNIALLHKTCTYIIHGQHHLNIQLVIDWHKRLHYNNQILDLSK